jgi:glycosyltransferase involved in cell wall biosynthesis
VTQPLRVLFLHGPGDAIRTFEHWRSGHDDPEITHVAFSRQSFDVFRELGAEAWVLTSNPRPGRVSDGRITVEHRPDPVEGKAGPAYYLGQLRLAWQVWRDVWRFRANVLLMSKDPHPLLVGSLRWFGVKILVGLHSNLWPEFGRVSRLRRLLLAVQAPFFRSGCEALLSVSQSIDRQVRKLTGGPTRPIVDFLPLFRASTFSGIPEPDFGAPTFRIAFVGRIEPDKGVFDLVAIARKLHGTGRSVEFDVCGDGSALAELDAAVREAGVASAFRLHGWCNQAQLREVLGGSHAVIVPTTSDCVEGFNMVVVEALLAGRPVVTSEVCPALAYVRSAVREVPRDDPDGYRRAIEDLACDRDAYRELQARCAGAASRFLDENVSFGAALRHALGAIRAGRSPTPIAIAP